MTSKYKIIISLSALLVFLFASMSSINYFTSLGNAQKQLKTQSLPLSLDNIYTEIQKHIVEPYLVSSMMANDTFVHDWLTNDELDRKKIRRYLEMLKNKYGMFSAFLVSHKTKNYYTQNGFIETISPYKVKDQWYFNFLKSEGEHEINIDINKYLSNSLIMFINYKILDNKQRFIGATGVALKIEYINDMLKNFRKKYGFKVTFFNEQGDVVLSEKEYNSYLSTNNAVLKNFKNKIISKNSHIIEFENEKGEYIINTKYIPELNLYLTVEAKLDNYTKEVRSILYFNLIISFIITLIIAYIFYRIINRYNYKLEFMAFNDSLTNLYNRRYFENELQNTINTYNRIQQDFCIVFIDIDDFKSINDNYGHDVGDTILQRIAQILNTNIRETDFIARWGGEEIILLLSNTNVTTGKIITEKLRGLLAHDLKIQKILSNRITASFGITQFIKNDTMDSIVTRADKAMYLSKTNGKNRVTVL